MIIKYIILFSLPIIGAVIGWFTNFLAVKMLFHPREPKKVLGFVFQGVFPKRQKELATKLAKVVSNELFSTDELKERLTKPEHIELINRMVETKIEDYLKRDFPNKYPIINVFLTDSLKENIKGEVMGEITVLAPKMIGRYVNSLDSHIDIEAIVEDKVSQFSTDRLEQLMMGILKSELGFIERIGAIVGFFIGLVQVGLMLLQQGLPS